MKHRASWPPGAGDGGETRLLSGAQVAKDDPRVEACGAVDELVAALGVARAAAADPAVRRALLALQRALFLVGAELAAPPGGWRRRRVDARMVRALTARCRALAARRPPPRGFVVPGATPAEAALHFARAVARRCERRAVALARRQPPANPRLLAWLNRLSHALWLLARPPRGPAP